MFPAAVRRGSICIDRIVLRGLGQLGEQDLTMKELTMTEGRRSTLALYVDRSSQQWIVLDPQGQFWILPANAENAWNHRQPFYPTEETELEPIPGHYKYMLGLSA